MNRRLRGPALPAVAAMLGIVAVLALVGGGVLGRGGANPSVTPSPTPAPTQTPLPSVSPSPPPAAGPLVVDLDTPSGHDVDVTFDDETGAIIRARSGVPGDGMSVRWSVVKVDQIDSRTLRLTWVGFPRDEHVGVSVELTDSGYRLVISQGQPYPNTDGLGEDRVLIVEFDGATSADAVEVAVRDPSFTDD